MDTTGFRYFSAVQGHVVPRYGSTGFIAARYVPDEGFEIDSGKVVAIPASQYVKHIKEYRRAVSNGSLIEKTRRDYDAYQKSRTESENTPAERAPDSADKKPKNKQKQKSGGSK